MARRLGLLVVLIVIIAVIVTILATGEDEERPTSVTPTPTATPQQEITPDGVRDHLRALDQAAGSEKTRAAGTAGDAATARYVAGRLRAAGYRVTTQAFKVDLFRERSPARITGLKRDRDFLTLTYSGSGTATGQVRRIGLGCEDVPRLRNGAVALADRGTCTFSQKARNAQRAGANALLVASDRGAPFSGSLIGPGVKIPVLAVSTKAGNDLDGRITVRVDAESGRRTTRNVIGEAGSGREVVMAGAHLDSVTAGPGLNDNASGVAATLEAAEQLSTRAPTGTTVRFGFWAAEEIGLVGSRRYVEKLSRGERDRIAAYVNLDMVGTPKADLAVYDTDDRIEQRLRAGLGRDAPEERLGGSSDHASFERAGIPVGGLFSGLDRCYHRACDTLANVDADLAAQAARATAGALQRL